MADRQSSPSIDAWLAALERRHLADLTPSELARALRALSSCYVERRGKLVSGGALDSAGKRAAFALFYGPLHFLVTRAIVRALEDARVPPPPEIVDLGCGTGVAGAAWAIESGATHLTGIDRHPWAVAEATWNYRELRVNGRARRGDAARVAMPSRPRAGIIAAYTVNELPEATRDALLGRLLDAHARGARVLVIEPIARRLAGWWDAWRRAFDARGGRADDWRFATPLPERQRQLGRAAGLDPRELTARSLWLGPSVESPVPLPRI